MTPQNRRSLAKEEVDNEYFKYAAFPATIIFEPGEAQADHQEFEYVQIAQSGGVFHIDGDDKLRWHSGHRVRMVICRKTEKDRSPNG